MNLESVKKLNIPASPGVYQFYGKDGKLLYIGKAANLKNRVLSYWQKSSTHTPAKESMVGQTAKIDWVKTDSEIEALLLEANLVKKYQPPFNVMLRDDKRFVYIKVSLVDEIPGVFITRKIDRSGKYFGPFTSALAARETLRAIRKIWPYCTMRKPQKKPCFYYQINLCTGVCAGLVDKKEYVKKIIKPIILFLGGKKSRVIKNTVNIKKVLEHANVLGLGEKYANDVMELAKLLGLKKVPERIEGYDISNIFGREAVGAMVVFSGGEPDKSEYRKFKIKVGQGKANDVRMLKEVLERRMRHVAQWPVPDLIIIDGGKAQLNAALGVLRKIHPVKFPLKAESQGEFNRVRIDIPVIAVSKGKGLRSSVAPDKLFFPGEKKPLILPLASPALHLIKRVRDEAHRFAIGYHHKLRGKRLC